MMIYEIFDDIDDALINGNEPNLLAEFLSYKPVAESIDMTLPIRQYDYKNCPHCDGLCAFPVIETKKQIVYVCDWCEEEFLKDVK